MMRISWRSVVSSGRTARKGASPRSSSGRPASSLPISFSFMECGGEVVGYTIGAFVQRRQTTGWIVRLVVAERYRRRGFGESLVAAVIAALRERGAYEVYLSVAPENRAARALYARHGFLEMEFCPAYFGEGGDRCILRRDLTGREDLICSGRE